VRWFFQLLRWQRDGKAIERGRVPRRIWNRGVSKLLRRTGRKFVSMTDEPIDALFDEEERKDIEERRV